MNNNRINLAPWLNWGISTFFVIFQFFLQTSAGMMVGRWKIIFGINSLMAAYLSAAFFYFYILMQIPVGILFDRYSAKLLLGLAAFLVSFSCFLFAFAPSYKIAFLARILMGASASAGYIGMLYLTALWFAPKQFSLMVSLTEMIGMFSIAAAELLLAWMVIYFGSRYTTFYSGWVAAAMGVATLLFIHEPAGYTSHYKRQAGTKLLVSLKYSLKSKQIWLAGLFGFFNFAIVNAFTSLWGGPFLTNVYNMNLHSVARMLGAVFIGMAIGSLTTSLISSALGQRRPIMLISSLICTVLTTILIFIPSLPSWLIYTLLFTIGFFSASYILSYTLVKETCLTPHRGIALALTNVIVMLSAPILQPMIGYLITSRFFHAGFQLVTVYRLALSILPIGYLIATFLTTLMQESYCKDIM